MGNKSSTMSEPIEEAKIECNHKIEDVKYNQEGQILFNIEIYGAQGCPTEEYKWHCAKKTVLNKYLNTGQKVVFFDDSKENIDAANELMKDYPDTLDVNQVITPKKHGGEAGYLLDSPEVTMWDYLKDNYKYDVIVFDFDFTLSDKHSGGTSLEATGPEHKDVTVEVGLNKEPFMNTKSRHDELLENLKNISKDKTLVILSRGGLSNLVNAFSKTGFNITKAIGIGFDGEKIVLTTNNPNTLMDIYNKKQQDSKDNVWDFSEDDCSSGGGKRRRTHTRKKRIKKKSSRTKRRTKRRKRKKN